MHPIQKQAIRVLRAAAVDDKLRTAHEMARLWQNGEYEREDPKPCSLPDHPGRPQKPELVAPSDVKRRRLGSPAGRTALLHAIAHIEFNAINLAADMVARFASDPRIEDGRRSEFISDWVGVCDDEARHFSMIDKRLRDLGSSYGAYPAHNGLWEAALATQDDLAARLVIAPMVLEARGLDVTPLMIEKLNKAGDRQSADVLAVIYDEEIAHVRAGVRWFKHICTREDRKPERTFKALLQTHYKGTLKPPFNVEAREKAGLEAQFYCPDKA